MCGYVAQLIRFPPINSKSGTVNDPSNYLKSQIGKGSNIVLLLRQLPPISIYTALHLSIIIHSIHLHGFTRLRRQDSSFIADGVSQSRSVVRGVRVSSHEAVGLINTANGEDETLLSYNISRDETHELMITVSLCMSNKSCFDLTRP